jgi:hypothetical protein
MFYGKRLSAPRPNTNLEDQVSLVMTTADSVAQVYSHAMGIYKNITDV